MTVKELIEALEPLDPSLEVRLVETLDDGDDEHEPTFHYPNISYVEYDKKSVGHPVITIY